MHNPDFRVFKNAQTDIEFIVRNIDRKPINLTGRKLFATLVDHYTHRTMAKVPLTVIDPVRGIARLTFEPYMVKDMQLGFHRYSVSYMLDNGNSKLLSVDQYETAHGYFELEYGDELQGIQSQEAVFEHFMPVNSNRFDTYYISPNFKGNLQNGSLSGLHTFAWYMENWTGSIWAEGSLVSQVPDEDDWFPIMVDEKVETKYERASGIQAHNLVSNLQWVRFKVRIDQLNAGNLSKILFRN